MPVSTGYRVPDPAALQRIVALSSMSALHKRTSASAKERDIAERLLASERRLSEFATKHGIACTILRPTLIWGAGMDHSLTPFGLRVITNNLNVASILSANAQCEVIVVDGVVRARDKGIVGEAAVDFIRQFKVDIAVIGISGIEADGTLRDYDYREVKVSQTITQQARETWLAADYSKFNRPAMVEVAHLSQIDRLFTDRVPPEPFTELLEQAQVRYEVAPAGAIN